MKDKKSLNNRLFLLENGGRLEWTKWRQIEVGGLQNSAWHKWVNDDI